MKIKETLLGAFVIFALSTTIAGANHQMCGLYADMNKTLIDGYGEAALPVTLLNNEGVTQIYINTATGTWTILQINGEVACVLGVGPELGGVIAVEEVETEGNDI